jgi:asparagine synthase (glutamine-hydrolysing)
MRAALAAMIPRAVPLTGEALARLEDIARNHGLSVKRLASGTVLAAGGEATVGRDAALIGPLYAATGEPRPDRAALVAQLDMGEPVLPATRLWGDYLGIASSSGRGTALVRAAFGNLPCWWIDAGSHVAAASSMTLLEALALRGPEVDWRQLATYLLSPQMRGQATCLERVRELPGGSTLRVRGDEITIEAHWSPWGRARPATAIETLDEAAPVVGAAIDHAVAARCGGLGSPVLLLSGGLDSSVLAASLARSGCGFASLTLVTRHRNGDERRYARAVAAATGGPLTERMRTIADIDWDDATPVRQPRPSARMFRQPTLAAARRLAAQVGTDTIIDGGGGDDLFCSLQSVAPLLDRLAIEGAGRGAWRTARDTALRAQVGLGTVAMKVVRRLASGRTAYRWPVDASFLTADARALAPDAVRHPWLDPPAGTLPGYAAHVALVLDALGLAEDDSTDPALRTVSPLVAQPVVEAALRVRSWLWFADGRNRTVIRRAFADRLPAAVIDRTSKGTPMGFMGEVVEGHREKLRAMLLDGLLVAHGIADVHALEAALKPSALAAETRYAQLLVLADAERWARLWS